MRLQGKILLQFVAAWLFMPVALLFAQWSGIAQRSEFIVAVLLIASIGPLQIYVNEIFAPISVCKQAELSGVRLGEVSLGISLLAMWACYSLNLAALDYIFCLFGALTLVWLSFGSAKRVLLLQIGSVIGGRYSFVVGALPSIVFLCMVMAFWGLQFVDQLHGAVLYLLVIVPTLVQYMYLRLKWPTDVALSWETSGLKLVPKDNLKFLMGTILLAWISQHWKLQLVGLAAGYAALSVYLISPVSSLWLVYSKAQYVEQMGKKPVVGLWFGILILPLTLLFSTDAWWVAFLVAFLGQALAFKFITDARQYLSAGTTS